jgi:LysM repeat protein
MKKNLVFLFFILTNVSIASPSIHLMDSIGIEKRGNQTFILHQVSEKETLFGISKRYQTTVNDLVKNNEVLQDGLKIGQTILIPYTPKTVASVAVKEHKVGQGETLFSISKLYGVSVSELMAWNNLKGNELSIGQSLKIEKENTQATLNSKAVTEIETARTESPTPKPVVSPSPVVPKVIESSDKKPSNVPESVSKIDVTEKIPGNWLTHTVSQGETLFAISKKYGTSVDDIMSWNALTSNNLKTGQKLKVGREQANPELITVISSSNVPEKSNSISTKESASSAGSTTEETNSGFKNIKETGLAEVIEGSNNHKKYLVLHRTAPVGTIMRVRNEENDITIFARVVGKLPETGDNSRLVVKLSKAAYDQLRAVNARFPVEISF